MSNVRALISRIQRQRFRTNGACSKTAFNANQMQATHLQPPPESENLHWSVAERRFALLAQSVNGLRFAHLNSQKVGILQTRRPSLCSDPVRLQRAIYCESTSRFARTHSVPVRRRLRSALFSSATFVRFGHQRPNPSIEGTHKRLRLLRPPHVKR
jgi:hypothetical protein